MLDTPMFSAPRRKKGWFATWLPSKNMGIGGPLPPPFKWAGFLTMTESAADMALRQSSSGIAPAFQRQNSRLEETPYLAEPGHEQPRKRQDISQFRLWATVYSVDASLDTDMCTYIIILMILTCQLFNSFPSGTAASTATT